MPTKSCETTNSTRTICLKILEYTSALRQLQKISSDECITLSNYVKETIKTQDFSNLTEYTFKLYEKYPEVCFLGNILDLIILRRD